jgi:LAO/AO transport system kinase
VILVETVGVGQDEVEVVGLAHTVVVLQIPGMGDEVQNMKAGILEVANLFVVNKSDLPGADRVARNLRAMFASGAVGPGGRRPEIVKTEAITGSGIEETLAAIDRHRDYLRADDWTGRERRRLERRFYDHLRDELDRAARHQLAEVPGLERILGALAQREIDPYSAARQVACTVLSGAETPVRWAAR